MDYQKILEDIWQEIHPFSQQGKQADYIPALAKINPDQFGICLQTVSGDIYSYKQADTRFSPNLGKFVSSHQGIGVS